MIRRLSFTLLLLVVEPFRNIVTDRTGWRRHRVFGDVCDPPPHTWQTAPCVRHPKLLYCYIGIALLVLTPAETLPQVKAVQTVHGSGPPRIEIWHGTGQYFGESGNPQRWVNVLGRVCAAPGPVSLQYALNGQAPLPLSLGPDQHRLASPGDFNLEIDIAELKDGANLAILSAQDARQNQATCEVTIHYRRGKVWPLPYRIDWSKAGSIPRVAQIVDGRWKLEAQGARTVEPYYDRVLAIGDLTWTNYGVTVQVTFHGFTGPPKGPPHYGVTHAGISLRWRGHTEDGKQPHVQWHPLGAATEFQLFPDLTGCHWRIIAEGGKNSRVVYSTERTAITLGKTYWMKARVESLPDRHTRYRTKIWASGEVEPKAWAVESIEGGEDFSSGSLLLVAHNSDVTFGNLEAIPLKEQN
ncbi:MAG: hypothetical protein L0387_35835 [Acidobacteria bacterium]|nr:hypothetical protein [Acidobacteriota bacterium]MCI0724593.1 hypothetical protein [Acidobacteriota bacterium]